jgi:hypothetical protein
MRPTINGSGFCPEHGASLNEEDGACRCEAANDGVAAVKTSQGGMAGGSGRLRSRGRRTLA